MQTAILLYVGQSENLSERVFIGILTGVFLSVIFWIYQEVTNKNAQKKAANEKEQEAQKILKDTASEIASNWENDGVIDYNTLYEELKGKCDPSNFMSPYNAEKIERANAIYSQIEGKKHDIDSLIKLRNQAINLLGISFSAESVYKILCDIFDPSNFMGENYDATKLSAANRIYASVQQNKDNIIVLEKIAQENGINLKKGQYVAPRQVVESSKPMSSETSYDRKNLVFLIASVILIGIIFLVISQRDNIQLGSTKYDTTYLTSYINRIKEDFTEEVDAEMDEVIPLNDTLYFDEGCIEESPFEGTETSDIQASVRFTKSSVVLNIRNENLTFNIKKITPKMLINDTHQHLYCIIQTDKGAILFSRVYKMFRTSYDENGEYENLIVHIDGKTIRFRQFAQWK